MLVPSAGRGAHGARAEGDGEMTAKKSLKRLIRERQQATGERYTTAREKVLAAKDAPPRERPWVELHDASELAGAAGFVCPVHVSASIWRERESLAGVLDQLWDILTAPLLDRPREGGIRG